MLTASGLGPTCDDSCVDAARHNDILTYCYGSVVYGGLCSDQHSEGGGGQV